MYQAGRSVVFIGFAFALTLTSCLAPSGKITVLSEEGDGLLLSQAPEPTPTASGPATAPGGCGCTYEVDPTTAEFDGNTSAAKPGDVICLKPGTRGQLSLTNLVGTAEKPIVVKNCGGRVVIDHAASIYGILVRYSQHIRITGTGDPAIERGIFVKKVQENGRSSGIELTGFSSDYEVDHIEVTGVSYGVYARTATDTSYACEPKYEEFAGLKDLGSGKFAGGTNNARIHHLHVHDVRSKGFFMASAGCGQTSRTCNGVAKMLPTDTLNNADIHHNVVERTGYQLFQLGCGRNNKLHHNVTTSHGLYYLSIKDDPNFSAAQKQSASYETAGFNFQGEGEIYSNTLDSSAAAGNAIAAGMASGNVKLYNNVIRQTSDKYAFFSQSTVTDPLGGLPVHFVNNTVIGGNFLRFDAYGTNAAGVAYAGVPITVKNNLLVDMANAAIVQNAGYRTSKDASGNTINYLTQAPDLSVTLNQAMLKNPGLGDYSPLAGSPAIDGGDNSLGFDVPLDHGDLPRVKGAKIDFGAHEFQSN